MSRLWGQKIEPYPLIDASIFGKHSVPEGNRGPTRFDRFLRRHCAQRVPVGRVCRQRAEGVAAPHDTGINPAPISRRQPAPGRSPNPAPAARHVYRIASQARFKPQRGGMALSVPTAVVVMATVVFMPFLRNSRQNRLRCNAFRINVSSMEQLTKGGCLLLRSSVH